ncbi:site-specific DNA-methyltransferase [Candidatus Pacearchaeota archaeon]|nr:site-specific DNA-methyltransferase [Candidatus Pacearchaeota archaeon]
MTDIRMRIVDFQYLRACDILPNPDNWRVHSKEQQSAYRAMVESIGYAGAQMVFKTDDGDLMMIDGHMRQGEHPDDLLPTLITDLDADEAREVLATFDPIAEMAEANREKVKALHEKLTALKKNTSAARNAVLKKIRESSGVTIADDDPTPDPGAQIDKAAELNEKWQVERGDVWEIPSASGDGVHRIMCGDSTSSEDVGLLMDGVKAEMLFTSPPYADQREYSGNDLSVETLANFIPVWKKYCNYQCVNLGLMRKENEITQYWDLYLLSARKTGLKLLAWNIWDKINATSVQSQMHMFALSHEFIFVFGVSPKKINRTLEKSPESKKREKYFRLDNYGRKVTTRRQKDGSVKETHVGESYDKKQLNSVLPCYAEMARNVEHPAKFPPELISAYAEAMTDEQQMICDPFLGSGTTLVACEQTGRVGYGMEISPDYVAVCLERLAGMGLEPVLLDS